MRSLVAATIRSCCAAKAGFSKNPRCRSITSKAMRGCGIRMAPHPGFVRHAPRRSAHLTGPGGGAARPGRPSAASGPAVYADRVSLPEFDRVPDIRLIAADMDGTLLDDDKELHDHFWPLADELFARGILFCPASGRQYHTLHRAFGQVADELVYIAENGAYVVRGREEISADPVAPDVVRRIVLAVRALADAGADVGLVVCGKRSAYVERTDPPFQAETVEYYAALQALPDVLERPEDDILKVAVFDFGPAEQRTAPALARFAGEVQVTVSGEHWVDLQNLGTSKGSAIRAIQRKLGITREQTMVFGDFLNDLEMMDAAHYSFAMDNAHPLLAERARFTAPPNTANGVIRTISAVLGLPWTGR